MSSGCGVWKTDVDEWVWLWCVVPEIINYRCRVGVVMVCGILITDVEWVWLWCVEDRCRRVGVVVVCGRPMSSGCGCGVWYRRLLITDVEWVWLWRVVINYRCRVGVVMVCGTGL